MFAPDFDNDYSRFKKGERVTCITDDGEPLDGTVVEPYMTSSTGEMFAYVIFDDGTEDTVSYDRINPTMKESKMKKHKINENFPDEREQKEYEEAFRYAMMELSLQEIYELIRDMEHDEFYDNSDSWMDEIGRPESEMENYFDDLTSEIEEVLYGQDAVFTAYCDARDKKEKSEKISTESRKMKKLNITKEQYNKSEYFQKKYGNLEYVSESGKLFKTSKGQILKLNESVDESLKDIGHAIANTGKQWKDAAVQKAKDAGNAVRKGVKKVSKKIGDVFKGPFRKGDQVTISNGEDSVQATITAGTLGGKEYEVMLQRNMDESTDDWQDELSLDARDSLRILRRTEGEHIVDKIPEFCAKKHIDIEDLLCDPDLTIQNQNAWDAFLKFAEQGGKMGGIHQREKDAGKYDWAMGKSGNGREDGSVEMPYSESTKKRTTKRRR